MNLFNDLQEEENLHTFTTRGMQFHFHSPSEHTIEGRQFDMEMHIVHKLMYVQKNSEDLFKKWRYCVTSLLFEVPKIKTEQLTK